MTQEEKVKRYDEAIGRAKNYYSTTDSAADTELIELIFPELKESEDERIRKELIEFFTFEHWDREAPFSVESARERIAWLEKQGDQKPAEWSKNEESIICSLEGLVKDAWRKAEEKHDGLTIKRMSELSFFLKTLNPSKKQKLADKVEPKFKVGNWITNGIDFTFQIHSIDDNMYLRSDDYFIDIETADKNFRLWTIQDAKDGDVLVKDVYPHGISICLFKEYIQQSFTIKLYCSINREGQFLHNSYDYYHRYDVTLCPATKEQRNLLFQKMKEAGYKWDAEKKELKKIEQNNSWSEEDEKMLNNILMCGEHHCYLDARNITWLKSIKDKYTWKPSNEQILSLERASNSLVSKEDTLILRKLLEQLKKLKEK